jgi:flavin-dependent dehydrogenase
MRFGIVGARLAGSYAASALARLGHEVLLLDPASAGEKPCGGGITGKARLSMPWMRDGQLPCSEILTVEMVTPSGCTARIKLSHPMLILARATLDASLLDAALRAGARLLPERAVRCATRGEGWSIQTSAGSSHEVDFLVGADGANSLVRTVVASKFAADDFALALGHYLPGSHHPGEAVIAFQEFGFCGYLWSFPRPDHISIGIIQRLPGVKASDLRRRVLAFMSARYPEANPSACRFFAARVPCLSLRTLLSQRTAGTNWALLGDAAGFADAITSEGIYFAIRSAQLLADAIRSGNPVSYEARWRQDFGDELEQAAAWRDSFYSGTFLRGPFTQRTVGMMSRSATVRRTTDDLISGRLPYRSLRNRLLLRSPRILVEVLTSAVSGR